MTLLEISHLTGGYTRNPVLKDVSFNIKEGELVGLIGLNGAGKSTTIKHVIGLMEPQKGEIRIRGNSITDDREAYRRQFSFVPETPILYDELTLEEHLRITAMAYGMDETEYEARVGSLLREFRMEKRLKSVEIPSNPPTPWVSIRQNPQKIFDILREIPKTAAAEAL